MLGTYRESMRNFERELIREALSSCQGNVKRAARRLDMSRPTLLEHIRALGLAGDLNAARSGGEFIKIGRPPHPPRDIPVQFLMKMRRCLRRGPIAFFGTPTEYGIPIESFESEQAERLLRGGEWVLECVRLESSEQSIEAPGIVAA